MYLPDSAGVPLIIPKTAVVAPANGAIYNIIPEPDGLTFPLVCNWTNTFDGLKLLLYKKE
jgi:hypothetical protein